MTGLLEKALHRLEALPPEEQDSIATEILEMLGGDAVAAIQEGIEAEQRGRTRPAREALSELGQRLGISS